MSNLSQYSYDGDTVRAWAGTSQWRAWQADLMRFRRHGYSGWCSEGFWAVTIYRLQRSINAKPYRRLMLPLRGVMAVVKKMFTAVTHINLPPDAEIGPGLLIPHVGPIQVNPGSRIGADCSLHHTVTLGFARGGAPTLEDHVMVGCHVCVIGPATIGPGARVGAGVTVTCDVAPGATVVSQAPRVLLPEDTIAAS